MTDEPKIVTKSKIGCCYHCDKPVYPPERYDQMHHRLPMYPLCDECKGKRQVERKIER